MCRIRYVVGWMEAIITPSTNSEFFVIKTTKTIQNQNISSPTTIQVPSRVFAAFVLCFQIAYFLFFTHTILFLVRPIAVALAQSLRHCLAFGVGLHHAGLQEEDRKVVENLFCDQKIQILVATR